MSENTTPEQQPVKIKTGFLVLLNEDGNVFIDRSIDLITLEIERPATMLEVRRGVSEILMDLQAQAAAEYTRIGLIQLQELQNEVQDQVNQD